MEQLTYRKIKYLQRVLDKFTCGGEFVDISMVDGGRINATYKVTFSSNGGNPISYILQKLNPEVFPNVDGVMANAIMVTDYLRSEGQETLSYVHTKDGNWLFKEGTSVYRMMPFIKAKVRQSVTGPRDMRLLGGAVASFANGLRGFDANKLIDTIPDFHNTPDRFDNCILSALSCSLHNDERIENSREELDYVISKKKIVGVIEIARLKGDIPTRVTHNDTKLNNVLFDLRTNKPRCMIDLDTVMKGTPLNDIADAIRYGANVVSEEEKNAKSVDIELGLVEAFLNGYAEVAPELLSQNEIDLLPMAIMLMPMELGMRFLTDYYNHDKYFKVSYKTNNLVRARVQFALARKIEEKMDEITKIIQRVFN